VDGLYQRAQLVLGPARPRRIDGVQAHLPRSLRPCTDKAIEDNVEWGHDRDPEVVRPSGHRWRKGGRHPGTELPPAPAPSRRHFNHGHLPRCHAIVSNPPLWQHDRRPSRIPEPDQRSSVRARSASCPGSSTGVEDGGRGHASAISEATVLAKFAAALGPSITASIAVTGSGSTAVQPSRGGGGCLRRWHRRSPMPLRALIVSPRQHRLRPAGEFECSGDAPSGDSAASVFASRWAGAGSESELSGRAKSLTFLANGEPFASEVSHRDRPAGIQLGICCLAVVLMSYY
jgi:hypothetical protein